jgi:hypothetical protein
MVRRWFRDQLGMYDDVAGVLAHLSTVDNKVSFGSPLTPVLCSLIHRPMFDQIAAICNVRGLRYSVWVDDLTISGQFVPGDVLGQIREIVRTAGLRSHRIAYRSGNRPVFITGIGVVGPNLVAPNGLHLKIRGCWADYHSAITDDEKDAICLRLLSYLGTVRQIAGGSSPAGQKATSQMNSLRQEREMRRAVAERKYEKARLERELASSLETDDLPF